ncbi:GNAT family N-acetyltransferase [Synechocystis sp. PCC 7509]|uniref:GNAT family N-acetyltransferase n=1 Tax=Synechocystis sp. PCC 7509 TaxID=927677 RepID=UPI0002ABF542|nr:GNAT family N-acetyltransferase [Synechocystis sp. PCC 7509]
MELISGYQVRAGSSLDRALLAKFMQKTYQELAPKQDFSHLALTVEQYLSRETPLWWVSSDSDAAVACVWAGNAIDQITSDRIAHIFLLYVNPEHRRKGIARALMNQVETWAITKGFPAIELQVFQTNDFAKNLYNQLGYQTRSLSMVKPLK